MAKFDARTRRTILRAVRDGYSLSTACGLAKVHRSSCYNWINRGKQDKHGEYRNFYLDLEEAKATYEGSLVSHLNDNMDNKTALSLLERKNSRDWGVKQQVEIQVKEQQQKWLEHLAETLPPHIYTVVLDALDSYMEEEDI